MYLRILCLLETEPVLKVRAHKLAEQGVIVPGQIPLVVQSRNLAKDTVEEGGLEIGLKQPAFRAGKEQIVIYLLGDKLKAITR